MLTNCAHSHLGVEYPGQAEQGQILACGEADGACVHELIGVQVERTPEAVALAFEGEEITYRELDRRAGELAAHLGSRGVGPDKLVGICYPRSIEMVIAMLAALKAGGAYVPLDPTYPKDRLTLMAQDADLAALITQESLAKQFAMPSDKAICLEEFKWGRDPDRLKRALQRAQPENLAYVIYTSGSTGKPKGVMIRHQNAASFFSAMDDLLGTEPGVWLAVTSICFDISVLEILWSLSRGFKVVIQKEFGKQESSVAAAIRKYQATHFQCTPSLLSMLIHEPGTCESLGLLKALLIGGEPFPAWVPEKVKPAAIYNMYGPTETTVWSTATRITAGDKITVGWPLSNTQLYVLGENLQPAAPGEIGEIFIGGEGVARGYLNRPELTKERFLNDPFCGVAGARMYRTGDLGRFLPDGQLEHLGRTDFQVKLRGFRIELGEIENELRNHVKECAVTVEEFGGEDKRLVAYCVPAAGSKVDPEELRTALRKRLPEYMVPSVFHTLAELPLTPNGKLDRKALQASVTPVAISVPREWNATQLEYPRERCLHQTFELRAQERPESAAIIYDAQEVSYGELDRRANQLARYLHKKGVRREVPVGIWLDRSPEMVVALLAVLKAGGTYVPLDMGYPPERLQFMLEDTRAPLVITQTRWVQQLPKHKGTVICLDSDQAAIAKESGDPIDYATECDKPEANQLAYVIYTSGSTGKPKGVAIEHRSANAFIHWARTVFTDDELKGTFASTSICFDLSIFELFVPLSWGGTVILADNVMQLEHLPARQRVTLLNTVPSAAGDLLRGGGIPESVVTIALAGEVLTPKLVDELYRLGHVQKVYDLYGPSETTTYSTYTLRQRNAPATIGKPIANTFIYILDPAGQPVPVGTVGELYIGGDGLARGYLNRPDATAERFLPDPFSAEPNGRMYRTGDLAQWLPDGNIEFLGRQDHQVKIRGYRIELGEIEAVLGAHPAVNECAAIVQQPDQVLTAYVAVAPSSNATAPTLRHYLREKLPDYMVPSALVMLDRLPRTPSGKIDRRSLPAVQTTSEEPPEGGTPNLASDSQADAMGPIEQVLAQIWREVIGVKSVGPKDNFFDLGGHSVLVIQILSRVRTAFGVELLLRDLFEAPTVLELARVIEERLVEQVSADEGRALVEEAAAL